MSGTIAIWYEPARVGDGEDRKPTAPLVEVHVNFWRDLPTDTNFLDIGLLLSRARDLQRFYLYVPALVTLKHLQDLSSVLKFGRTLNGVFNTVVDLGSSGDRHQETTSSGNPFITLHDMRIGEEVTIEPLERDDGGVGSKIIFGEDLCRRIVAQDARGTSTGQYVRIRIRLEPDAEGKEVFSEEIEAEDRNFVSSASRLEVTEFRFNEKRSYPNRLAQLSSRGEFHVTLFHYFLIRKLDHQLVMQHEPSRKVRRLEPDLWHHYLTGEAASSGAAAGKQVTSRMVIYHWRKGEPLAPFAKVDPAKRVDDFVGLAGFRSSTPNLLLYALIVVLLGVLGNALGDFVGYVVTAPLDSLGQRLGVWPHGTRMECKAALAVAVLSVIAVFLLVRSSSAWQRPRWIEALVDFIGW